MSSGLEKSLFQLKFTTKQLQKQSRKASKDETTEKAKLRKELQRGKATRNYSCHDGRRDPLLQPSARVEVGGRPCAPRVAD
ncbi:RHTO0S02e07052g1_1 [Rhodotorula toruloides]|uniref:RHTO0S02e07052g1_1 n=1 Tax=Rhodotorula toruloides TaxID=5286 RepID=A0A061AGU5_RHOTO|nr:RHTO0S02e07052g1_1 [Rhodotorula toruloides]